MCKLSVCMHYYIYSRLQSEGWSQIAVIFSDANVPGEGEHKIVNFIRWQRRQPNYQLNTKHVLCGSDADLILLGLATHETSVTVMREQDRQYVFVRLRVLRECLKTELTMANLEIQFDSERAIDDWIFLCSLIGNDYIPGLPFLKNVKSTLYSLVKSYKDGIVESKV